MGFTRDIIMNENIPEGARESAKKCFMCNNVVINGGTWAGSSMENLVTVCNSERCTREHISWLIDIFISDEIKDIRHFKTKQEFMDLMEKVYVEKSNHPKHN